MMKPPVQKGKSRIVSLFQTGQHGPPEVRYIIRLCLFYAAAAFLTFVILVNAVRYHTRPETYFGCSSCQ